MNRIIIPFVALVLCLWSCDTKQNQQKNSLEIQRIENGLIPNIIIEGEKPEVYTIHERMNYHHVSGVSIAFIENGEIKWAKGYGFTDFDSVVPVNEKTLFQAASISKPVAALAALSLVEEGKIGLDDNVNDYLKGWQVDENEFTRDEKVTLRRLLSHSAGLTVHGFGGYAAGDSVPTVIQILNGESPANSGKIYPNIKPGEKYRYSGGGYTVMQKMLEDISGKPFPQILDERVISKIGMTNSSYVQPLLKNKHQNAAVAHRSGGEKVKGNWHTYPEMAAAGLWTTPSDLVKYALEVQKSLQGESNKVLSPEMTKEMLTIQAGSHGLGPALTVENGELVRFSHGGANDGYRCQLLAFTKTGQGIAIMTNGDNGGTLYSEILRAFSEVYNWDIYKPQQKVKYPVTTEHLEKFAGKYKLVNEDLIIEFEVEDDHLKCTQLWTGDTFLLFAESEQLFFDKNDGKPVKFKMNEEGAFNEVAVLNQYKFVRIE